jgi:hypothetical protein
MKLFQSDNFITPFQIESCCQVVIEEVAGEDVEGGQGTEYEPANPGLNRLIQV